MKEWKFLTPAEYEAKKNDLPDVCFATRHEVPWLLKKAQGEIEEAKKAAEEAAKKAAEDAAREEEKKAEGGEANAEGGDATAEE